MRKKLQMISEVHLILWPTEHKIQTKTLHFGGSSIYFCL